MNNSQHLLCTFLIKPFRRSDQQGFSRTAAGYLSFGFTDLCTLHSAYRQHVALPCLAWLPCSMDVFIPLDPSASSLLSGSSIIEWNLKDPVGAMDYTRAAQGDWEKVLQALAYELWLCSAAICRSIPDSSLCAGTLLQCIMPSPCGACPPSRALD